MPVALAQRAPLPYGRGSLRFRQLCADRAPSLSAPLQRALDPSLCNTTDRSDTARSAPASDTSGRSRGDRAFHPPTAFFAGTTRSPLFSLSSDPSLAEKRGG